MAKRSGVMKKGSTRANPMVRSFLGARLLALRKERGLSQEALGRKAGLSGKFIGEVQRGSKSISIDSLYRVSVALEVPLTTLTAVTPGKRAVVPSEEAEKIFALLSVRRPAAVMRKAHEVVRAMLGAA